MRIVAKRSLQDFWATHRDAKIALNAWYERAKGSRWKKPSDVKAAYANASFVGTDRVVFNIGGNKYRLVVSIWYRGEAIWVKFIGTHEEYDKIDVATL